MNDRGGLDNIAGKSKADYLSELMSINEGLQFCINPSFQGFNVEQVWNNGESTCLPGVS